MINCSSCSYHDHKRNCTHHKLFINLRTQNVKGFIFFLQMINLTFTTSVLKKLGKNKRYQKSMVKLKKPSPPSCRVENFSRSLSVIYISKSQTLNTMRRWSKNFTCTINIHKPNNYFVIKGFSIAIRFKDLESSVRVNNNW